MQNTDYENYRPEGSKIKPSEQLMIPNPTYLIKNEDMQKELNIFYDKWVSKIISGEIEYVPFWENDPDKWNSEMIPYMNSSNNTQERCDYVAYQQMRQFAMNHKDGFKAMVDKMIWKPAKTKENIEKGLFLFRDEKMRATEEEMIAKALANGDTELKDKVFAFRENAYKMYNDLKPLMKTMVPLINETLGTDYLKMGISNNPMLYKEYMGNNGYMGWHTNCDNPGYRWYLVYNTHANSSYFRWIDPRNGHMYQAVEPKGWSINQFKLTGCEEALWHTIYTSQTRLSIGLWAGRERPLDVEQAWIEHGKDLERPDEMDLWSGGNTSRGDFVDYREKYCNKDEADLWNEED